MTDKFCDNCRENPISIPYETSPIGQATDEDLLRGEHECFENFGIEQINKFYHYFVADDNILNKIITTKVIKSRTYCMCENCINRSMFSEEPHYGDGAYGTANPLFYPDDTRNPISIVRAHGISFNERIYRAVVRIKRPQVFRKFRRTGGVVRSQPSVECELTRYNLIAFDISEAEVIRIERWNESESEWIPFMR